MHDAGTIGGPTALLWPSLFTDGHTSWGAQLPALHALKGRTLLVDPYGTGESTAAARHFTMEECADAALQVLDAAGVDRAAILGLSWGGFVALRIALSRPDRVAALVLSNTSARAMPWAVRQRDRVLAKLVRAGVPTGLGTMVASGMLGETTQLRNPELAANIAVGVDRLDRTGLSRAMRSVLADRSDISAALHTIRAPTLVLDGAEDRQFARHHSRDLGRCIPGARLIVLPHAGHLAPREAAEEVTAHIELFLTDLNPY